jgi:hypothetical protein
LPQIHSPAHFVERCGHGLDFACLKYAVAQMHTVRQNGMIEAIYGPLFIVPERLNAVSRL